MAGRLGRGVLPTSDSQFLLPPIPPARGGGQLSWKGAALIQIPGSCSKSPPSLQAGLGLRRASHETSRVLQDVSHKPHADLPSPPHGPSQHVIDSRTPSATPSFYRCWT